MSAVVKLSSAMPGDPSTNGVDVLAPALAREGLRMEPGQLRVALVWFDTKGVATDTDSGSHVPIIRIRRFEPLGTVDEVAPAIRDAVQAAVEARTGRKPIPFGLVEVEDED